MENWPDLYVEIATKIVPIDEDGNRLKNDDGSLKGIAEINWVDLWKNQVNFLSSEHPFRTPAIFLRFRTLGTKDLGEKQQEVNLQIDFYLYYETFLDTFSGAYNQEGALEFLKIMEKIHGNFHGTAGENYSSMRRVGFNDEESSGAGNLYKISFTCLTQDTSAMKYFEETTDIDFEVLKEEEDYVIPG